MKKFSTLLFEMLFFIVVAQAQQIVIVPTIEKTVGGTQAGSILMMQTKKRWSIGGFYQRSIQQNFETAQPSTFYGLMMNAPLVRSGRINFFGNVRVGLVDQTFMVVVPGLETELIVTKRISLSSVMSIRMTYPSAAARINFKI